MALAPSMTAAIFSTAGFLRLVLIVYLGSILGSYRRR
jgi:hypothetical protein